MDVLREHFIARSIEYNIIDTRIAAGACEKVASDFGLGNGFRCGFRVSPTVPGQQLQLASHVFATMCRKKCQKINFLVI